MNNNIIQNSIDNGSRNHIKKVVENHYGFIPTDEDIDRIDKGLRNNYGTLHPYRIINRLAISSLNEIILNYREALGIELEEIELDKLIFRYIAIAKMCFNEAIPYATICLCRTAIEAGLREKVAEELAKKEPVGNKDLSDKIFEQMERLKNRMLGNHKDGLLKLAEDNKIITKEDIEQLFKNRFGSQSGRKILDKFVHGDIFAIYDFLQAKGTDTTVIGAKDKLDKRKIVADMSSYEIAFDTLRITTEIAEILYLKNHTKLQAGNDEKTQKTKLLQEACPNEKDIFIVDKKNVKKVVNKHKTK